MKRTRHSRPLRLGVQVAIMGRGGLLLIRRGDLKVWALPGGRLDTGETLAAAVVREAWEETGLRIDAVQPLGLYYLRGFDRVNVLYRAEVSGGHLLTHTDESRGAAFFPPAALPPMPLAVLAADAAANRRALHIVSTPPLAYAWLRLALARRYVINALRRRPEPRFPALRATASALIPHPDGGRVLTLPQNAGPGRELRTLPRLSIDGRVPPWRAIAALVRDRCGVHAVDWRWAGVAEDGVGEIEFVFTAHTPQRDSIRGWGWSARHDALTDVDYALVSRTFAEPPGAIWSVVHPPDLRHF